MTTELATSSVRVTSAKMADECTFLIHEPAEVYHRQSGHYLSSHLLGDFRKSPLLYHRKRSGLVPDRDGPSRLLGRAAHTMILEGHEEFQRGYAVGGPVNPKTGLPYGPNTKAASEWAAAQNKEVLSEDQYELIQAMSLSVKQHECAQELLSDGVAEGVARADYRGLPCQIRMDWFDPHQGIVDLKTCDDLTWFEADARRYGYGHQLAFYRAVLAQVIGVAMPTFFIAVEKKEPFRCGVWKLTDNTLSAAQQENEAAIQRLKRCRDLNQWPTGYEECRFFDYV